MILEVENLKYAYSQGKVLFESVNFSLAEGQILSILGANGVGKSTLLNCIANLLLPIEGIIRLNGIPVGNIPLKNIARLIGYVPQNHSPAYGYAVRDFVAMGRAPYLATFRSPGKEDYDLVDKVLDDFRISHLADRAYTDLSGGERQQVSIARAVVQEPKIIMLDEPTNHLDYGNQLRMIEMIRALADKGFGVIMTSHTPDHVLFLGGDVGILDSSVRLSVGSATDLITEKRMRDLYGIDVHLVYEPLVHRVVCVSGTRAVGDAFS